MKIHNPIQRIELIKHPVLPAQVDALDSLVEVWYAKMFKKRNGFELFIIKRRTIPSHVIKKIRNRVVTENVNGEILQPNIHRLQTYKSPW